MCFLNLSLGTAAAAHAFPCFHFTKCNNNMPMERGVTTIAWNNYCWRFRSHRSALIFQTHKRRDMCTTRWEMENKFLNEFTRAHTKESTHLSEFKCRPRNDRDRHFPILRTDVNRCSSLLSSESKRKRRLEKSSSDLWGDFSFKFYEFLSFWFSTRDGCFLSANHLSFGWYFWLFMFYLVCSSSTLNWTQPKLIFSTISIMNNTTRESRSIQLSKRVRNTRKWKKKTPKWLWLAVDGNHEDLKFCERALVSHYHSH